MPSAPGQGKAMATEDRPRWMEVLHRVATRYDYLESQGRWGTNDQPDFCTVDAVLKALPVQEVKMLDRDTLYIRLFRELTVGEVFELGRLNPDDPPEMMYPDERLEFRLWWD